MRKLVRGAAVFGVCFLLGVAASAQGELTGNDILDRMREKGVLFLQEGDLIFQARFDLVFADGTQGQNEFEIFISQSDEATGEPDRLLIYYLTPEDIAGTIFLSVIPPEGDAQMWLYLPALGLVKELISETEQAQSFAGTTLTYEQIGGAVDYSADYTATRLADSSVSVSVDGASSERPVYVLEISAKPGATVDYPKGKLWVDVEELTPVRSEFYDKLGRLEIVLEILRLETFEDDLVPTLIKACNQKDATCTTIEVLAKQRAALPAEIFTPAALPTFTPAASR
ncbi:MAG: outer membrane lipoprotein-sorting protein [Candidatus Bipolaricaulis anaerobius]|nr:outer membrane lipoprotein-sorting protein [Candidatus Bipolaricaulis anaerobius]